MLGLQSNVLKVIVVVLFDMGLVTITLCSTLAVGNSPSFSKYKNYLPTQSGHIHGRSHSFFLGLKQILGMVIKGL